MKNFTNNAVVAYCLLHNNGVHFENALTEEPTMQFSDPLLDENFYPGEGSPTINNGTALFIYNFDTLWISEETDYIGDRPDIGAVEHNPMLKSISEAEDYEWRVFPNPFDSHLKIWLGPLCNADCCKIINDKGTVVYSQFDVNMPFIEIATDRFAPGFYFLNFSGRQGVKTELLLKI